MPWRIPRSPWHTMEGSRSQPAWGLGKKTSQEDSCQTLHQRHMHRPLVSSVYLQMPSPPYTAFCWAQPTLGDPGAEYNNAASWLGHSRVWGLTPQKTVGQGGRQEKTHPISEGLQSGFQTAFISPKENLAQSPQGTQHLPTAVSLGLSKRRETLNTASTACSPRPVPPGHSSLPVGSAHMSQLLRVL